MDKIWMQSLEGTAFNLLHPTPDMINWHTATIALARVHRFGGHTLNGPYSVAQHLVEGTRAVLRETGRRDWASAFLLHDFHEAYIGDIMTPVAKAIEALAEEEYDCGGWAVKFAIKELKRRIDVAVYEKAGMSFPLVTTTYEVVKEYDYRMAVTERAARLAPHPMPWHHSIEARKPIEGCDLTPWREDLATSLLRAMLKELLEMGPVAESHGEGCGCGADVIEPWAPKCCTGRRWENDCYFCPNGKEPAPTYTKQKEEIWRQVVDNPHPW